MTVRYWIMSNLTGTIYQNGPQLEEVMIYLLAPALGWFIDAITKRPVGWFLMQEPASRNWIIFGLVALWLFTWWFYRNPLDVFRSRIRSRFIKNKLIATVGEENSKIIDEIVNDSGKSSDSVDISMINLEQAGKSSVARKIRMGVLFASDKMLGFIGIAIYAVVSLILVFVLFFI